VILHLHGHEPDLKVNAGARFWGVLLPYSVTNILCHNALDRAIAGR
jgi:hypothetical protein